MDSKELEFTTRLTREDVAGIIEALVEGLKDGHLKIQKSSESLELDVPRVIDLEVEAKLSDERAKFAIEVSWRTNRAENPDLPTGASGEGPYVPGAGVRCRTTIFSGGEGPNAPRKSPNAKGVKGPVKRTPAKRTAPETSATPS